MGKKTKTPVTPAVRILRKERIDYTEHLYDYEVHGGTARASRELGIDEHQTVKTLVMQDADAKPLVILMHGDHAVSTKELARAIGTKHVTPCEPEIAEKHSGYRVGGTSPFGTRRRMHIYMQKTIADLPRIYINGGHRGFLLGMSPAVLQQVLQAMPVDVAIRPE